MAAIIHSSDTPIELVINVGDTTHQFVKGDDETVAQAFADAVRGSRGEAVEVHQFEAITRPNTHSIVPQSYRDMKTAEANGASEADGW